MPITVFEWLPCSYGQLVIDLKTESDRLKWLAEKRKGSISSEMQAGLLYWYGEKGNKVKYARRF